MSGPVDESRQSPDERSCAPGEQRRWLFGFWILLVAGPCLALGCEALGLARATAQFVLWRSLPVHPADPGFILMGCSVGASFLLIRSASPGRLGCAAAFGILALGAGLTFLQAMLLLLLREVFP